MSQSHDLHRALLRPAIIHTLRAVGFHSTKPSVLDTLVNIAERHLQLLAATTAQHALASHNDPLPTITDVRMALTDCGVLIPLTDAAEEGWRERLRRPLSEVADVPQGGKLRAAAEKRKRGEEDTRDVREFEQWFAQGATWREIRRVAGMGPPEGGAALPAVGVGGGVVQAEDFLTALKKKYSKGGADESRWVGTVMGPAVEERELGVDGGPDWREWKPRATVAEATAAEGGKGEDAVGLGDETVQ